MSRRTIQSPSILDLSRIPLYVKNLTAVTPQPYICMELGFIVTKTLYQNILNCDVEIQGSQEPFSGSHCR